MDPTDVPARDAATQAERSATVEDLLTSLGQLGLRYRGDSPERDRHRGDDAERITGEIARHLAIARVRLAATTLPHEQDGPLGSRPREHLGHGVPEGGPGTGPTGPCPELGPR